MQHARVFGLTLEQCWHTVCQHCSREVLARANSTPGQVLAQSVLTAGSRGVRTHWRQVSANMTLKNRSHFAQNRSNFLARFRSQANTCSNSVPTASLAGARTLCQQQNQGRCWHQKRSNSAPQCSNVRTKTLVSFGLLLVRKFSRSLRLRGSGAPARRRTCVLTVCQ